jgi:hypothetical protein
MSNFATNLGVGLASVIACGAAAQTAPAPAPAHQMQWYFTETVQVNSMKGGADSLVALNQTLSVDLTPSLTAVLNVPLYAQSGQTSLSNIQLGAEFDAYTGKGWDIDLNAGVYIPVGEEFFRNENVNPYFGGVFNTTIAGLDFSQSVDYTFVGGNSYFVPLAAKTDSDVLAFGTDLFYKWESFKFGAELDQYYYVDTGEKQLFLGPTVKWSVASNVDLSLGVGIPVYQDVVSAESNALVTASFGIKF